MIFCFPIRGLVFLIYCLSLSSKNGLFSVKIGFSSEDLSFYLFVFCWTGCLSVRSFFKNVFYCLSGLSFCTKVCLSVRGPVFLIYCLSLGVQDGLYFFGRWFLSLCFVAFLYVGYFIFLILIELVYFVYLLDGL